MQITIHNSTYIPGIRFVRVDGVGIGAISPSGGAYFYGLFDQSAHGIATSIMAAIIIILNAAGIMTFDANGQEPVTFDGINMGAIN